MYNLSKYQKSFATRYSIRSFEMTLMTVIVSGDFCFILRNARVINVEAHAAHLSDGNHNKQLSIAVWDAVVFRTLTRDRCWNRSPVWGTNLSNFVRGLSPKRELQQSPYHIFDNIGIL